MPHSVLLVPAQRPARVWPSPALTAVQGVQPIEGSPGREAGCTGRGSRGCSSRRPSRSQSASGFSFQSPNRSSQPNLGAPARVSSRPGGCRRPSSRRRPGPRASARPCGSAAGVRVAPPELVAVERGLLVESEVVVALELDAVALGERVAGLVGLREEHVGVEVEEARAARSGAPCRRSPSSSSGTRRRIEARAEALERPGDGLFGARSLEVDGDLARGHPAIVGTRARSGGRWRMTKPLISRTRPRRARPCRARAVPVDELLHRLEAELGGQRQVLDLAPRSARCRPARRRR